MVKKMKKSKPSQETLQGFKEIQKFISNEQQKKNTFSVPQKKIKMPLKMYMGIKKAVLKKNEKEKEHNKSNEIIGETHKKQKLMTKIILNKLDTEIQNKKNKKLVISRNKNKCHFKEGVLTLNKNFKKYLNKKDR